MCDFLLLLHLYIHHASLCLCLYSHPRICWFSIPFSLATSLGLAGVALLLPITKDEAGEGLVPPAVATHLLGCTGSVLILTMLFMVVTSAGSAKGIAISSLVSYNIYREYINPDAMGEQILNCSHIVVVIFGLLMGNLVILLNLIGLNLGWVYLFMGVWIGSAIIPLWNLLTWDKASGKGAILATWGSLFLALTGWLLAAKIQSGTVTVENLGTNEVMLSGNLIAIISSGFIHYVYSRFVENQVYDFTTLNDKIRLVEQDMHGLGVAERDPVSSIDDMMRMLKHGIANQATAATNLNEQSSQLHMVLSVEVSVINKKLNLATNIKFSVILMLLSFGTCTNF